MVQFLRVTLDIGAIDRLQRQSQRVEPAQETVQSSLIDRANQRSEGSAIALRLKRHRHPSGSVLPTVVEVPWYLDPVGCEPIHCELGSVPRDW